MEQMLHYVWQHRMFPLRPLTTTDGKPVEVIGIGRHNRDAGPDFLDAAIRIDGIEWRGNVEIHTVATDWYRHGHDTNPAYNNVILHVVGKVDADDIRTANGTLLPQLQLDIPQNVQDNYDALISSDREPRCHDVLDTIPSITVTSWLSALFVERLEQRCQQIMQRREECGMNWEDAMFVTVARNFGFGKNGSAFEQWAMSIPMSTVAKHRNDLFQIEAIFFGQAGLLEDSMQPKNSAGMQESDEYYQRLRREYSYLRHKFSLQPINPVVWRFLRLRPQNFPHIRIAQLAMLYYQQRLNLSRLLSATTADQLYDLLQTEVNEYWQTHYTFASTMPEEKGKPESEKPSTTKPRSTRKHLSRSSQELIIINSVVPLLFAYGRYKFDDTLCERAVQFMESLKPENNHIIANWREAGIVPASAADSQAIIQLSTRYCAARDCLRCRFGSQYISRTPGFLHEDD